MPTSIPFDPSLVLANVVDTAKIDQLAKISSIKSKIDAEERKLQSAILTLRSLDMTVSEMLTLGIDVTELKESRKQASEAVKVAAEGLTKARVENLEPISKLQSEMQTVGRDWESPVDWNRTEIKQMPLSADSMRLNAQYFSFDKNEQDASNSLAKLSGYVSAATSFLGAKRSFEIASAATAQVASQRESHTVEGTLIITATCTHKNAAVLAPFILNADKALRTWNEMFPDKKIKVDDPSTIIEIAKEDSTGEDDETMQLLSGASYGSSFVGMVHVLRTEDTQTSQKMMSTAASMQGMMETGSWFASAKGGFGVSADFARDVKRMLSTQTISSHCSVISLGSIPSIKSSEVQIGVKSFADFDPAKMMGNLAALQNATAAEKSSVQEGAKAARTGAQMMEIRSGEVQSVMLGLDKIDDGKNMMLDINSLMTAFEDYINKALAGNLGVPLKYYIKPLKRAQIAQMWCNKYFPGEYMAISADDSDPSPAPAPTPDEN